MSEKLEETGNGNGAPPRPETVGAADGVGKSRGGTEQKVQTFPGGASLPLPRGAVKSIFFLS